MELGSVVATVFICQIFLFPKRFKLGQKNTLVSGNAGDQKNLHPGDRKPLFFNQIN